VVEEHLEGLHDLETVRREELAVVAGLDAQGTLVVPEGLSLEGAGWHGKVLRFNPAAPLKVEILEPTPARVACTNAALAVVQPGVHAADTQACVVRFVHGGALGCCRMGC
ncbi:MAG: hypothetical protein ACOVOX_04550, partial [Burkholderiaceae bacterium]